jgi:hypothetical protein
VNPVYYEGHTRLKIVDGNCEFVDDDGNVVTPPPIKNSLGFNLLAILVVFGVLWVALKIPFVAFVLVGLNPFISP